MEGNHPHVSSLYSFAFVKGCPINVMINVKVMKENAVSDDS